MNDNTKVIFKAVKVGYEKFGGLHETFISKGDVRFDSIDVANKYNGDAINVGGAMDMTSGIFTVPFSGLYFFTFSGLAFQKLSSKTLDIFILVKKNGNRIYEILDTQSYGEVTRKVLSSSWMSKLEKGDKIQLSVWYGSLAANKNEHIIFTGQLIMKGIFLKYYLVSNLLNKCKYS